MKILVLSLDYDGCLFNREINNMNDDILELNRAFLDNLVGTIRAGRFEKVILTIGSSRQSTIVEVQQRDRISAPDYAKIQSYLQAQFTENNRKFVEIVLDPFRIVDINNCPPTIGKSFKTSLALDIKLKGPKTKNGLINDLDYILDSTKISLILAQMHRVSALHVPLEHENHEIVFQFYDDSVETLRGLDYAFFTRQFPIPGNLSLEFYEHKQAEQICRRYARPIPGHHETYAHPLVPYLLFYAVHCAAKDITAFSLENLKEYISQLQTVNFEGIQDRFFSDKVIGNFRMIHDVVMKEFAEYAYKPSDKHYVTATELVREKLLTPAQDLMRDKLSLKDRCLNVVTQKIEQLKGDRRNIVSPTRKNKITAFKNLINKLNEIQTDEYDLIKLTIMQWIKNTDIVERKHTFSKKTDTMSVRTCLATKRFRFFDKKDSIADSLQIILDLFDNEEDKNDINNFLSVIN